MVAHDPTVQRVHVACPGAEAVYVMGTFNNWSTTRTPMHRIGDERWEVLLPAECVQGPLRLFVWIAGRRCGRIMPWEASSGREATLAQAPLPPLSRV